VALRIRYDLLVSCLLVLPPSVALADEPAGPLTTGSVNGTVSTGAAPSAAPAAPAARAAPAAPAAPAPAAPAAEVADRTLDDRGCLDLPPERTAADDAEGPAREDRDYRCFSGGIGGPSVAVRVEEAPPRARGAAPPAARPGPVPVSASFGPDVDFFVPTSSFGPPVQRPQSNYAACFLPGTRILTPAGERAIEDLRIGDLVTTASGDRPVMFVPRQTFRRTKGERWAKGVAPIRVEPGAFAEGLPHRPLFVSPCHAFYVEGLLVEARDLVNGSTIVQVDHPGDTIEYLNIELEDHDLVRANGVLVETFRPSQILGRESFDNFAEYVDLYPGQEYQTFPAYAPYKDKRAVMGWWQNFALRSGLREQAGARV
jgi:Hint domain